MVLLEQKEIASNIKREKLPGVFAVRTTSSPEKGKKKSLNTHAHENPFILDECIFSSTGDS